MAKFKLRAHVRRVDQDEVRTVEEIRENPAAETLYSIQLGRDFATRVWAKEGDLEQVEWVTKARGTNPEVFSIAFKPHKGFVQTSRPLTQSELRAELEKLP
jgi:hypothetical protein